MNLYLFDNQFIDNSPYDENLMTMLKAYHVIFTLTETPIGQQKKIKSKDDR